MKALDTLYQKSIDGIQKISPTIDQFANDYSKKQSNPQKAAKSMIKNQIAKCTTSGFITGFGGVITLPVTIPVNVGSVLYVQMRMIACTAYMAGLDINCDKVQTLVYACLAGVSVNEIVKKVGVKMGEKGLINLGKLVPGVGAVINGGLDFAETRIIGNRAYKMFVKGDFSNPVLLAH